MRTLFNRTPASTLSLLGIATLAAACGNTGGFADTGTGLIDVGFVPRDAGPDAGVVVRDGGGGLDGDVTVDGDVPDTGEIVDAGPQPDSGTPGATFSEQTISDTIVHGQGVEVVDLDGDGDLDVVAALSLTDAVHAYLNDGSGGGWTEVVIGTNVVAMEVDVEDLDGDGDKDVVAVGLFDRNQGFGSPGEVTWYENPGTVTGAWTRRTITGLTFWGARFVEAGDLTGDGRLDLVVGANQMTDMAGNPQGNGLFWFRNEGGGSFAGPTAIDADLVDVLAVALHDVDGNQTLDIMALGVGSSQVAWWANGRDPGTPNANPPLSKHVIATPPAPFDLRLANMDEDGDQEIVVTMSRGNGAVVFYDPPADPTQPWAEVVVSNEFGAGNNSRLHAADLDGDGRTDVAVGAGEATSIRVFFQGDNQSFTPQAVREGYGGLNWLTGGDLDGDGRIDLVTATYEFMSGRDLLSWWTNQPQ